MKIISNFILIRVFKCFETNHTSISDPFLIRSAEEYPKTRDEGKYVKVTARSSRRTADSVVESFKDKFWIWQVLSSSDNELSYAIFDLRFASSRSCFKNLLRIGSISSRSFSVRIPLNL